VQYFGMGKAVQRIMGYMEGLEGKEVSSLVDTENRLKERRQDKNTKERQSYYEDGGGEKRNK
jgi:hypothetical protein